MSYSRKTKKNKITTTPIRRSPLQSSTPLSPAVVNLHKPNEQQVHQLTKDDLWEIIDQLNTKVSTLETKLTDVESKLSDVESKVSSLQNQLTVEKTTIAIATNTSTLLRRELDKAEQYSRRSCVVLSGVPTTAQDKPSNYKKKVETILNKHAPTTTTSIDKAHPIGPIIDGKQSLIVKFSKHSSAKKVYQQRKQIKLDNIFVRPSLTKKRMSSLKKSKEISARYDFVNFVFADIEGNLKICFKNAFEGKSIHTFNDEDEMCDIIRMYEHQLEYDDDRILVDAHMSMSDVA